MRRYDIDRGFPIGIFFLCIGLMVFCASQAEAQAPAEFYEGKTIH